MTSNGKTRGAEGKESRPSPKRLLYGAIRLLAALACAWALAASVFPGGPGGRAGNENPEKAAESGLPARDKSGGGKARRIAFDDLGAWEYDPDRETPIPDTVRDLDGRKIELTGFMFPLEYGDGIRSFCLLRTSQTCCFLDLPWYNQYVLVEMENPVQPVSGRPVTVVGAFHVDPRPEEGYIYWMNGDYLAPFAVAIP